MTQIPPTLPLRALFDAQHSASRQQIDVPLALRRDRLGRLKNLIDQHGAALSEAVQADFGVRSRQLTEVADLFVLRAAIGQLHKELPHWMKTRRVATPLYLQPASAHIQRQPLGVVGVIAPWNYPVQLALAPAITALAAGNRVMIKPSELTPHTSAQMAMLVAQMVLGIVTVLMSAHPHVAITHQIGAVILWVLIIRARHLSVYPVAGSIAKGTA